MAKRKSKKKQQSGMPWQLVVIALIGGATYYYTNNMDVTIYALIGSAVCFVVFSVWRSLRSQQKISRSNIHQIDAMTGIQFEEYLVKLFKKQGYRASMTKTSGDYGADLVLKGNGETIVVQAKRYKSSVGVKAVQEIIAAIRMYDADYAWVVTNSYFTKQAQTLAKHNDVRLIDRDELLNLMDSARRM